MDWYDLSINNNDELELRDILPNKEYNVKTAFKDKYDWIYVVNFENSAGSHIEETNLTEKIIYFGPGEVYSLASNGRVYVGYIFGPMIFGTSVKVMLDGVESQITEDDSFDYLVATAADNASGIPEVVMRKGVVYGLSSPYSPSYEYSFNAYYTAVGYDFVNETKLYFRLDGLEFTSSNGYFSGIIKNVPNDFAPNYVLFYLGNSKTLWCVEFSDYTSPNGQLTVLNCWMLIDNVQNVNSTYIRSTAQGTKTFIVALSSDGVPEIVEYSAPNYESKLIILQPLN